MSSQGGNGCREEEERWLVWQSRGGRGPGVGERSESSSEQHRVAAGEEISEGGNLEAGRGLKGMAGEHASPNGRKSHRIEELSEKMDDNYGEADED